MMDHACSNGNCAHGNCSCCGGKSHSCKSIALLVLRLALAAIFIFHGYGKLFGNAPGMDMFTGMVGKLGFPMPGLFAYAAALSEFLGGIAMLLGIFTNVFGWLIAIVMFVAFVFVKKFALPMGDADLALFAMAVAVALMGPGAYSLEAQLRGKMGGKSDAEKAEKKS